MSERRDRGEPPADIEIGATVRADRLRFRNKPEVEVEYEPEEDSDSHAERENLPDEVEPGRTYRDVRIAWRGGARIAVRPVRDR
jgi:hypothetical protein